MSTSNEKESTTSQYHPAALLPLKNVHKHSNPFQLHEFPPTFLFRASRQHLHLDPCDFTSRQSRFKLRPTLVSLYARLHHLGDAVVIHLDEKAIGPAGLGNWNVWRDE